MSISIIIGLVLLSAVFIFSFVGMLLALRRAPLAVEDASGFREVSRCNEPDQD